MIVDLVHIIALCNRYCFMQLITVYVCVCMISGADTDNDM